MHRHQPILLVHQLRRANQRPPPPCTEVSQEQPTPPPKPVPVLPLSVMAPGPMYFRNIYAYRRLVSVQ